MHEEIIATLRNELRNLAWPGEVLEHSAVLTRRSWRDSEETQINAFALNEFNVDAAVQDEILRFQELRRPFEWKVFSFDTPPDLLTRLETAGLSIGALEKVVIYSVSEGIAALEDDFACEVRRVDHVDQLTDFRLVAEEVFGKDYSLTTNQLKEALRTGQTGHDAYVGYIDGRPVCVARLYTNPNSAFAGLYGGGTLPEYRGQGCYRAVVAARARDAVDRGAKFLLVDALPTSLPILLRLGFVQIADTWACTYTP